MRFSVSSWARTESDIDRTIEAERHRNLARQLLEAMGQARTYGRTRSPKSLIASMILSCGGPPE
jgi:hypothetical protein